MAEYTSQEVVINRDFANILLGALKVVPGGALLATGKVRLSSDPAFAPQPGDSLASYVAGEATFSGYPAGGIAVSLHTGLNVSTQIQGALTTALFIAATAMPFVPGNVTGYWIDDGTIVAVAEKFAGGVTVNFGAVGDFLELDAVIPVNLFQAAA